MEINIHSALIQLLDTSNDIFVDSLQMETISDYENEILINKAKKALSLQKRVCELKGEDRFNKLLLTYKEGNLKRFSNEFGRNYYELKKENSVFNNSYLIYLDVRIEDNDYLIIIDNILKTCVSHNSEYKSDIENHLIEFKSVLPKDINNSDRFIIFDYLNSQLEIFESNDNKNLFEKMFNLESKPTINEAYKVFESKVIEVCQINDIPLSDSLPDFKTAFNQMKRVDPEIIAKEVFNNNPIAQDEFKMKLKNEGIKEDYYINHDELSLPKKNRVMKYVTESGIEIIVPAGIAKRKDKVEITTNPDGTTSINIKNISKLKNKF